MSDLITVEVTDGIQIITINRPEAKNAINLETAQAMAAALDQLDSRDDVRIGILTGGGGTFSSGMDLKAFAKSGQRPYVEGRLRRPDRAPAQEAADRGRGRLRPGRRRNGAGVRSDRGRQ